MNHIEDRFGVGRQGVGPDPHHHHPPVTPNLNFALFVMCDVRYCTVHLLSGPSEGTIVWEVFRGSRIYNTRESEEFDLIMC